MEITEVRVRLVGNSADRLRAFCTMTFDNEFVVRDIRVIEGPDGYFIAMPSRKMSDHCGQCGASNALAAKFCNGCGRPLSDYRAKRNSQGRAKLHADIAHPINPGCRTRIEEKLVTAYKVELERSKQLGYRPAEIEEWDKESSDAM